jgi:hypothetical protein
MRRMSLFAATLVLLFLGVGVADVSARDDDAPLQAPSFLRNLDPGGAPFSGVVVEEVPAGGYVYRHVRTDADELDWVVDLGDPGLVGQRVKVRPFGLATDFRSARTGRVFDHLYFAIVRSEENT